MRFLALVLILAVSACASARTNREYGETSFHGVNQDIYPDGEYVSPHTP